MITKKSKICIKCGITKPIAEFIVGSVDAKSGKKESAMCRACRSKDVSTWSKQDPEKREFFGDRAPTSLGKKKKKKKEKLGLFQ